MLTVNQRAGSMCGTGQPEVFQTSAGRSWRNGVGSLVQFFYDNSFANFARLNSWLYELEHEFVLRLGRIGRILVPGIVRIP